MRAFARSWFGALASISSVALLATACLADESPAVTSPVTPQESLEHLVVASELKVELVACEPQIVDPVAVRFDETGRLWVVEMRDYPTGDAGGNPNDSRISVLEDRDGEGFFETATVFADNLRFATGVQPWKGGVFVTMAGQVAYMKDTSGDNKADVIETWYTGFAEQNTQLRANHPRLALDNHIYIANGLRGGKIVNVRNRAAQPKPVDISGMDFRFDPLTGLGEAVSGVGQFGLTFDDYGNRFVCSNRNPAMHIVLENRYLKKNPLAAISAVTQDVATAAEQSHVYPIARSWTTSILHAGQFTAACGVEVYRGDALPNEYYGNIFTCEPTGHLVHREIMKPKGVTFQSTPAHEGREFLASRDPWFSPVNLENGPDGALYVVDMYRAVIEHPDWVPAELQHRPDQLWGNDRGRIYRIASEGGRGSRRELRLKAADLADCLATLSHPNSWQRETAARLLLETPSKDVGPRLAYLALMGRSPLQRIHALRLMPALFVGHRGDEVINEVLGDADPRIVEQAIYAAESRVGANPQLHSRVIELCGHAAARVRMAAMLVAAPHVTTPQFPADRWELDAMLVAAGKLGGTFLSELLKDERSLEANAPDPMQLVADAARLAAASPAHLQWRLAVNALLASEKYRRAGLASFLRQATRDGTSMARVRVALDESDDTVDAIGRPGLNRALTQARDVATDAGKLETLRCEALNLAAFHDEGVAMLAELAASDQSQPVRLRAIALLGESDAVAPFRRLLQNFSDEPPKVQGAIVDGLLKRNERISLLLDEIAAGRIKPSAMDATRTAQLLKHRDEAIRKRAEKVFADAVPADRQHVLAEYQVALEMKGDPVRGRDVFAKHCATCHRIGDVGVNFAPDISDSRERTPAQYLTDILQPNRAVDANYFSYTALTVDGLAITGVLAAETSTSVTLKENAEKETTLRRDEIEQLANNGVSLMPEGLEKEISPEAKAD
jgi:putative membrane-bound dehydrogenase-like protein